MDEIVFIVAEAPKGGYTAQAQGESIFTEADDLEDLQDHIQEAVLCHFGEDSQPPRIRLQFV